MAWHTRLINGSLNTKEWWFVVVVVYHAQNGENHQSINIPDAHPLDKREDPKKQCQTLAHPTLSAWNCLLVKHDKYANHELSPFMFTFVNFFPPPLAISDERQISGAVYNLISLTEALFSPSPKIQSTQQAL